MIHHEILILRQLLIYTMYDHDLVFEECVVFSNKFKLEGCRIFTECASF